MTSQAILEPLSEATELALRPLRLREKEHLVIGVEDEGHLFIYAKSLRPMEPKDESVIQEARRIHTDDGRVFVESYGYHSREVESFFQRIPESKPLGHRGDYSRIGQWKIPKTDYSAIMIEASWPKERVLFTSEEARVELTYLVRRFHQQSHRAGLQAAFKIKGELPEMPLDFVDSEDLPLSSSQKTAVAFSIGQEGTGLFMDKGTGKTAVTIARICTEAKRTMLGKIGGGNPRMMRVLCVVQNKARLNWIKELERFATVPGKCVILRGGQIQRMQLLTYAIKTEEDCAFSVVVAGYDTVSKDVDIIERVEWDLTICDESHNFKSPTSLRWKSLKRIRDRSLRRMVLTGSPIGNNIFDLWTQLEFLFEGASGFSGFKAFRHFHGQFQRSVQDSGGNAVEKLVGLRNIPLLQERLSRLTFALTKKEAGLHLPDKVYDLLEVSMTPQQTEFYRKIATQLAIQIESFLAESKLNKAMTTNHILTQLLRLAQITSGFVRWDAEIDPETGEPIPGTGLVEPISGGNPKIDALIEELTDPENDPNEKTIVWCIWREDLRAVSEALTVKGIKHAMIHGGVRQDQREQAEQDFNADPTIKVLVCNPQTAGDSLNLVGYDWWNTEPQTSTYTGHEIYFSCNWSYLMRTQSEDRAHRRGTRTTVRITDLVVPGTIDEEIRERVKSKEQMALEIQDIRDILARILDFKEGNGE